MKFKYLIMDSISVGVSWLLTWYVVVKVLFRGEGTEMTFRLLCTLLTGLILIHLFMYWRCHLYELEFLAGKQKESLAIGKANTISFMLLSLCFFLCGRNEVIFLFPRVTWILFFVLNMFITIVMRKFAWRMVH